MHLFIMSLLRMRRSPKRPWLIENLMVDVFQSTLQTTECPVPVHLVFTKENLLHFVDLLINTQFVAKITSIKFIYFEKATNFFEISTLLLTGTTYDKSKVKISQNFVAFSEYMNFSYLLGHNEDLFLFQLIQCLSRLH